MQESMGRTHIASWLREKDFWTVRELADILSKYLHESISEKRIYRLIYKNKLKTVRMHRNYYIHRDEFIKIFDSYESKKQQ